MRHPFMLLALGILLALAPAAGAANVTLHGTVTELGDRHFVLVDGEGKTHVIWLLPVSAYRPADYRPAVDDEVDAHCFHVSRITKRLYLARVDFVREGFRPAGEAARGAEGREVPASAPAPAAANP